jgi:hypothetical protein
MDWEIFIFLSLLEHHSKMHETIDWEYIKKIGKSVPMSELGYDLTPIADDLYQIGPHEFVAASSVNARGELLGAIFYWSPSVGAVVRADKRDISSDDGTIISPPKSLLLEGWRWTHEEILEACKDGQLGPYQSVPVELLGKRIGRVIMVGVFTYFFRGEDESDEKAFVVGVDVRGIRWQLCG